MTSTPRETPTFDKYGFAGEILYREFYRIGGELFADAVLAERIKATKEQMNASFMLTLIDSLQDKLPDDKLEQFMGLADVIKELAAMSSNSSDASS